MQPVSKSSGKARGIVSLYAVRAKVELVLLYRVDDREGHHVRVAGILE